jgi:flagellar secretion chaperone FliS
MRTNAYQTYVEDEIVTADPIRLVQLLYQGAIEAVGSARANLAGSDIKGRSAAATKAIEILAELSSSLNHEQGGELSVRLAALYDYMQRRLIDGNQQQIDAPFAEVGQLLGTLGEAWFNINVKEAPARVKTVRADYPEQTITHAAATDYVPISCAY